MSSLSNPNSMPADAGFSGWIRDALNSQAWAASLGGGALAALGLAPLFAWPLTALGFIGLILLLDGTHGRPRPMRAAFARGFGFGLGWFGLGMYWIGAPFLQVDGAAVLAPLGIGLPVLLAAFWGAACALAIRAWKRDWRRIFLFAGVFTLCEWLRGHAFGGLPWNLPGYVWEAGGAISQIASILGIYGLTGLTLLAFCMPATLLDGKGPMEKRVVPTLAMALALGLAWGAGAQRLARTPNGPGEFVVRVVDSGLTQAEIWAPGRAIDVARRYLELTGDAAESRADVVIWPEGAMPFLLLDQPEVLDAIGQRLANRVLITGVTRQEQSAAGTTYYNSAAVLDGVNGALRLGQIYDKTRLVPFGEFIPFYPLIQRLGLPIKAVQEIGNGFEPGLGPRRLIVPGAPPAGPLICFEAIFPGYLPPADQRPEWLVNVTNDAWFSYGKGWPPFGPYQHYNQARYRAIESGLPMARAASGGISAVIDGLGRELAATTLGGGTVEATIPKGSKQTTFTKLGFVLNTILVFVFLLLGFTPGATKPGPKE